MTVKIPFCFPLEEVKNPFLPLLVDALKEKLGETEAEVQLPEKVVIKPGDLVHVHWPESLVGWRQPNESDIRKVQGLLAGWKRQAPLVVTVHNLESHRYSGISEMRELYRLVHENADAFIHMGNASREALIKQFPGTAHRPFALIPHGLYTSFPNEASQDEARARLGLHPLPGSGVFGALGQFRSLHEFRLLLEGFSLRSAKGDLLLIAGELPRVGGRLRRWILARQLDRWIVAAKGVTHIPGFVPDQEIQYPLRACDVLVIPRLEILNSGNVPLGFTFGRVVVGPNLGVVGELLAETGNPVFDPTRPETLARAMEEGLALAREGKGEENRRYGEAHWGWDAVARGHADFYAKVLDLRLTNEGDFSSGAPA